MKRYNVIIGFGISIAVSASALALSAQTITFDDLNPATLPGGDGVSAAPIPNGYGGIQWANFWVLNAALQYSQFGNNGYHIGLVSTNNVAFNDRGTSAAFSVTSGAFNFDSAYLTPAWNNGLHVEVQGFVGTTLTYDNTYTLNTTSATLINFDYLGVDKVNFIASGGVSAGYDGAGTQFAMDNLTIIPVPEPTMMALVGFGGLATLGMVRRRKRSLSNL